MSRNGDEASLRDSFLTSGMPVIATSLERRGFISKGPLHFERSLAHSTQALDLLLETRHSSDGKRQKIVINTRVRIKYGDLTALFERLLSLDARLRLSAPAIFQDCLNLAPAESRPHWQLYSVGDAEDLAKALVSFLDEYLYPFCDEYAAPAALAASSDSDARLLNVESTRMAIFVARVLAGRWTEATSLARSGELGGFIADNADEILDEARQLEKGVD